MNLEHVAKRARVSTATVSRALNNASVVKTSTHVRIKKDIEELKHHPNLHARRLVGIRLMIGRRVRLSEFCYPALTMVHIPRDRIGHIICERLMPHPEKPDSGEQEIVIDPEFVLRDSTGPAPN